MAQFGRALRSGRRGRKFKSCHLDHISFKPHFYAVCLFITGAFSAVPLSSVCLLSAGFSSGLRCPSAPLRERASSPLREFSFRVPLLFLAFLNLCMKKAPVMICTPKVRHIWRCIFLWAKQEEKTKRTRQN